MSVQEKILENSKKALKDLMKPAEKAFANPSTGITIKNKFAELVIKDCAYVTTKYLPIMLYEFSELIGKLTKEDIAEIVKSGKKEDIQLCELMMIDAKHVVKERIDKENRNLRTQISKKMSEPANTTYGIYGEYGVETEDIDEDPQPITMDGMTAVDILIEAFKVKK